MPATIAGALVGSALNAYGRKPKIPDLPTLDIGTEQIGSIAANRLALPSLEKLATESDKFSFDQISKMLEKAAPGFMAGLGTATKNAASLARGEIPDDVSRGVQSASAARSLAGGFGGSGLARNLTARDLGLTSLNLTGEGQTRLQSLGQFARGTFPVFDYTTAFITPAQKLNFDWQQNMAQYQVKLMKEQVAAAPDPNDVALAEGLDHFFETWKNVGMGALGGVGGMGGGGAAGAGAGANPASATGGGGSLGGWGSYGSYSRPGNSGSSGVDSNAWFNYINSGRY